MSPKKKQITALASVVEKLKEENLKRSKSFKSSTTGKGKGKEKGKGQVNKPPGNSTNMEKKKMSGRSRNQKMERTKPRK